ncbi:regulatory protein YycI of two-component signal transduction system YycFG [Caldalkalibacillus uzonensis]|uniref:Regulatory protein YycI of two-component signal transduction system YycFG n=1 Tax=Caldalkalibacillus uzonensis TaxID=353224 RepID=A0ABU0CSB6_9BACI|nr:two-component system regulatory protein YycI [Caldalkalibacillus uzonensis]MDQ0339309.1 regulatory protein YycI of two-component signal transduction system YycFG [Caldalkalibacillus uzonensis]
MNWANTKSILIVVFLCLNLFLGWQLWQKHTHHPELAYIYESSLDELLILHQITLDTELDMEQPHMAQLEVRSFAGKPLDVPAKQEQNIHIKDHVIISTLSSPYTLEGGFDPDVFKELFLKTYVYQGEDYHFSNKTDDEISYIQYYGQFPLFIGSLTIFIDEHEAVTGYRQVYFQVVSEGEKQPIISSYTSIRTLLDQQILPPLAVIRDVTLGYYGQVYDAENQILTPTWQIVFEDRDQLKITYVNAYTGAVELDPNKVG